MEGGKERRRVDRWVYGWVDGRSDGREESENVELAPQQETNGERLGSERMLRLLRSLPSPVWITQGRTANTEAGSGESKKKNTRKKQVKTRVKLSADPSLFSYVWFQGSEVQCEPILGCVEPIAPGGHLFLSSIRFLCCMRGIQVPIIQPRISQNGPIQDWRNFPWGFLGFVSGEKFETVQHLNGCGLKIKGCSCVFRGAARFETATLICWTRGVMKGRGIRFTSCGWAVQSCAVTLSSVRKLLDLFAFPCYSARYGHHSPAPDRPRDHRALGNFLSSSNWWRRWGVFHE